MTLKTAQPIARKDRGGFAVLLLFWLGLAAAQAQQAAVPGTRMDKPRAPGDDLLSAPAAVIQIRSAFSISPSMVKAIQAAIKNDLSQSTPDSLEAVPWNQPLSRVVPLAVPLDVQLTGSNVVVHIQILPTVLGAQVAELIIQGQIWAKVSESSLSFNTTLQTLNVAWGSRFFFYPLGMDAKSGSPIVIEIRVDRQKAQ
jgi:hypothetical protein